MRFLTVIAGVAMAGFGALTSAAAAPQILAAASTIIPVAFNCQGDICTAELQTICLEEERQSPAVGTPYQLAKGSVLQLSARDAQGRVVSLTDKVALSITALRRWTVVRVTLQRSELQKLGLGEPSVQVGRNVSLIPTAVPGDENPHDAISIATVIGPMRSIATKVMTRQRGNLEAAQYLSGLGLSLSPQEAARAHGAEAYWRRIDRLIDQAPARARETMREAYYHCRAVSFGIEALLPGCLKQQADSLMTDITIDYWKQARPSF